MFPSLSSNCIPFDGVHKKPFSFSFLLVVSEVPTTHPMLLTLIAELSPPPSVPRSAIPPDCVQENACLCPLAIGACPTTVPASLIAKASVPAPPRFCIPPACVQTKPSVLRLPFGK